MISPMVDQIYAKSIARFLNQKGYKKETIFLAIKSLEQKKWIITGQRSTKEEILNNPIKKKILAFIEKYPGIHARDSKIVSQLNMTRNPVIKHMVSLEAFNLVRSSKVGSTLNYFPFDLPDVFDDLAVQFHNPIVVDIIKLFLEDEHMTLMEMAKRLGVYHRAVQYHIKLLLKNNVLLSVSSAEIEAASAEKKVDTRRKYYRINQDLLLRYNRLFRVPPFSEWL
jgi:predicted transcriptional regulator